MVGISCAQFQHILPNIFSSTQLKFLCILRPIHDVDAQPEAKRPKHVVDHTSTLPSGTAIKATMEVYEEAVTVPTEQYVDPSLRAGFSNIESLSQDSGPSQDTRLMQMGESMKEATRT